MTALAQIRRLYGGLPLALRQRLAWLSYPILVAALARQLPPLGAEARPSTDGVLLAGLLSTPHGVGVAAHLCAAELEAAGVRVSRLDLSAALNAPREDQAPVSPPEPCQDDALLLHINPSILVHALIAIDKAELRRRRIGYWVWELETVPASWRKAGDYVHEIWAPSRFAAEAFRAALPHRPVIVVPHPAALAPPLCNDSLRAPTRARFGLGDDGFLALCSFSMSSGLARKNPLAAIAAFRDAFPGRSDARLILRCRDTTIYPAGLAALRDAARDASGQVVLLADPAPQDSLSALYAACDVYLSPHRSEGFGLNLAEAMLAHRAVIATSWSGNLDFMDDSAAALIPHRLVSVRDPQRIYNLAGARWAEPEHDALVDRLRVLAFDQDKRSALARAGAAMARERLSGGAAAAALRTQAIV